MLRVNISYSIDVEEIPNEVDKMLGELEDSFRKALGNLDRSIGKNPLEIMENIQDIRDVLVSIDHRLGDCSAILSGYIDLKANPNRDLATPEKGNE